MFRSTLKMISVSSAPKPAEGKPGENRERMDVALVQHAEHDVHHHDRDDQQQRQVLQRTLEDLARCLETGAHGGRAECVCAVS